ncbi:MAG: cyclopropane-fatty-acyl-phospholipid synthase family protein [Gammaproteobacteria bacterium]|nr:cyclopropane-fatty-acyl-phospholipid synthase family protein [Gammaproteobacteria bacterium]NNK98911.1 class I SAM-dependent methyltransferase [Xanthomonadales bacterium]
MKAVSLKSEKHLGSSSRGGLFDGLARKLVLGGQLNSLQRGRLIVREGAQEYVFGQEDGADELTVTITVNSPRFYGDLAFGGSIGAGEAWMQGYWECDNLVNLVRLMVRNRDTLDEMEGPLTFFVRPLRKLFHLVNRNTRRGAKRNIAAHYDLGNDFFALWLDRSMMYSCAIFEPADISLAEAQQVRLDRVCQRLDLQAGDHLVEIGSGWGALALHAAQNYGCRVTTVTISSQQYALAKQRVEEAGLADLITIKMQDYRDLEGQYDKLVSLEMIEAIGADQYDTYFAKCANLLKPGGRMLIQTITIEDDRFESYRKNVDFIQRYIFPGGCVPSVQVMKSAITKVTDMTVTRIDDIGLHYATTLNHWRKNFFARLDEVRELGYSEAFIRMWEYYLCYCEGGFLERSISDVHLVAAKPGA